MVTVPITIVPFYWVFPEDFKGIQSTKDVFSYKGKALIFTEAAANSLLKDFKISNISSISKSFVNRLLYV